MDEVFGYLTTHVHLAPIIIFSMLILAGFNIPVSEDGMLFISAVLAVKFPQHAVALFVAVYMGAYLSDLICYGLGRYLGPRLWKISFFSKMVSHEQVEKISGFYQRYGVITLIFGRFIPFGVRNGLFLTAGLGRMNFTKFALSDLLACSFSTVFFFSLYYTFGAQMIEVVKKANVVIFAIFVMAILGFFFYKRAKRSKASHQHPSE